MGKFFDEIPEFLVSWIQKQQVFYVASAPLDANGHVNVSTKGCDGAFHIVNARKVWYEDLTGSGMPSIAVAYRLILSTVLGVETISHLRENGRITILFNAFEGPPRIVRLFGKGNHVGALGSVVDWAALQALYTNSDHQNMSHFYLLIKDNLDRAPSS